MKHYNTGGFYIQLVHCNGEYKSLIDPIKDKLNADMNFANPGDHVPEAECNNQTIKECITAAFHCLPHAIQGSAKSEDLIFEYGVYFQAQHLSCKRWNITLLQSSSSIKPTNA